MDVELETDRLRLRQWAFSDFEPVADFVQDPDQTRYLSEGRKTRLQAWDWLCAVSGSWQISGRGIFAVEVCSTGSLAGWCGLWQPIDLEEPELAWSLFPAAQGNGYATEAARRVQHWASKDLVLPPLFSFVHPDNTPSRAVAERLGAEFERETIFRGQPRLVYRHRKF